MKVYDPESGEAIVSHPVGDEAEYFKPSLTKTHWEIDVSSRVEGEREKVITLAAISVSRAEVMSGRATLVLRKATPFNTHEHYSRRPYQHAKDVSLSFMPEGERYPSWEDRIFSDEDIHAVDSEKDTTLEHPFPKEGSRKQFVEDEHRDHLKAPLDPKAKRFIYANRVALASRLCTPITHTYTGWPLRHFKDLNEFLRVIRDVLLGHKHLYYKGIVLRRDIGIENVIIMSQNDETVGRLIDLDHAKAVNSKATRMTYSVSHEDIRRLKSTLLNDDYLIADEVLVKFLKYFPGMRSTDAARVIMDTVDFWAHHFGLRTDREIKLADIGWHYQVKASPDFSTHEARPGHQTVRFSFVKALGLLQAKNFQGALPFISVEVLDQAPIFGSPKGFNETWCRGAINDIESLFWVLTFICLVRKGPEINILRTELLEDSPKDEKLQNLLHRYFNSDDPCLIYANKRQLFTQNKRMSNDILANFHPYFEPLKNMMVQWLRIMILAYEHRKLEYYTIHDQIIHIIDKAIENLSKSQPNDDPKTKAEAK
ncbi:hypothetical protein F5887DRAFT_1076406 [Amanita rubescens]|nr:hypothetical protein F5887DRAFT_1076406 [Amanita rubescens]